MNLVAYQCRNEYMQKGKLFDLRFISDFFETFNESCKTLDQAGSEYFSETLNPPLFLLHVFSSGNGKAEIGA